MLINLSISGRYMNDGNYLFPCNEMVSSSIITIGLLIMWYYQILTGLDVYKLTNINFCIANNNSVDFYNGTRYHEKCVILLNSGIFEAFFKLQFGCPMTNFGPFSRGQSH